jgi:hypothetical protein
LPSFGLAGVNFNLLCLRRMRFYRLISRLLDG